MLFVECFVKFWDFYICMYISLSPYNGSLGIYLRLDINIYVTKVLNKVCQINMLLKNAEIKIFLLEYIYVYNIYTYIYTHTYIYKMFIFINVNVYMYVYI